MRKIKRITTTLFAAVMIMALGFTSAFATDGDPQPPAAPGGLTATSGYYSVLLEWSASPEARSYNVYMKAPDAGSFSKVGSVNAPTVQFKKKELEKYKNYSFYVTAVKDNMESSASNTVQGACVREMTYKLKIKQNRTLKSHAGKKAKYRLKRGQTVIATGFTAGMYVFKHNDSTFYCSKIRTSKRTAQYVKKGGWNYSRRTAELLVNDMKVSSKKNKMIWISTYTQHAYLFTGSKGNWKCVDDWECATGKASSPTPTGLNGKKAIWKKLRSHHGISWWSPFSSMNSLHGRRKGWSVGKPASGGCVRNPNENAKYIYKNCGIGTRVLIF